MATIHRPENADDISVLKSIIRGFNSLEYPVLFPVHPRTKKAVQEVTAEMTYKNIHFIEPLGYIDIIYFMKNAIKIITDSGGLHKETFWLKVPLVVIYKSTEWEETLKGNCNILALSNEADIIDKVNNTKIDYNYYNNLYYGDGKTGEK